MVKIRKKNKVLYYICGFSAPYLPKSNAEKRISQLLKTMSAEDMKDVEFRLNYYNKLNAEKKFNSEFRIKDLKHPISPKSYYFDTYEYARFFDESLKLNFVFGDVNIILPLPAITKSRPISGENQNNVILNLDKVRHFFELHDTNNFDTKTGKMIGRNAVKQSHREQFFEQYFDHPLCDLGQINTTGGGKPEWIKPKISIAEHLDYKYILSIEGNDVATNLKWIMASNSIAVAPKMKMESWYMEGLLQPGVHYIQINDDYGNLEAQLQYYQDHPKEATEIIQSAKAYRKQFDNPQKEDLISLLVLQKYLKMANH